MFEHFHNFWWRVTNRLYILGTHKLKRAGFTVLDEHSKLQYTSKCTDGNAIRDFFLPILKILFLCVVVFWVHVPARGTAQRSQNWVVFTCNPWKNFGVSWTLSIEGKSNNTSAWASVDLHTGTVFLHQLKLCSNWCYNTVPRCTGNF